MRITFSLQKSLVAILLLILVLIQSCKSKIEKLSIDDINGHISYQNGILGQSKSYDDSLVKTNEIINEYLSMKSEEADLTKSSNYYYYLARLYGQINWLSFSKLYDYSTKKIKNPIFYKNYYDSAFICSKKSLSLDSNNIYAMNLFCMTFYYDRERCLIDNSIIPYSGLRNSDLWNERRLYIVNNAIRFTEMRGIANDSLSRGIAEIALHFLLLQLDGDYHFDANDRDKIVTLYISGKLFEYLSKFDRFLVLDFDNNSLKKEFLRNVKLANEEVAIMPLYPFMNKYLNKIGWGTTSHSNPHDIQDHPSGNPVYYDQINNDNSEIRIILNSNKTYNIIYKPIYSQENGNVSGTWSFDLNSSEIILDKDVFTKSKVYEIESGLDDVEYLFIPSRIKFDGDKLILYVRQTKRLDYTVHLVYTRSGYSDLENELFTHEALKNLSLSDDYFSEYINYFK